MIGRGYAKYFAIHFISRMLANTETEEIYHSHDGVFLDLSPSALLPIRPTSMWLSGFTAARWTTGHSARSPSLS